MSKSASEEAVERVQDLATQWEQCGTGYMSIPEAACRLREVLDEGPPELESFASGDPMGIDLSRPAWGDNAPKTPEDYERLARAQREAAARWKRDDDEARESLDRADGN